MIADGKPSLLALPLLYTLRLVSTGHYAERLCGEATALILSHFLTSPIKSLAISDDVESITSGPQAVLPLFHNRLPSLQHLCLHRRGADHAAITVAGQERGILHSTSKADETCESLIIDQQ